MVSSKQVTDTASAFDRPVRDRSLLLLLLTLGDDCKAGKVDTLTHSEERPAAADDIIRTSSIIDLDQGLAFPSERFACQNTSRKLITHSYSSFVVV